MKKELKYDVINTHNEVLFSGTFRAISKFMRRWVIEVGHNWYMINYVLRKEIEL